MLLLVMAMALATNAQTSPTTSTDTITLTLEQAQAYAFEHNVTILNAALNVRITKMRTVEILSTGLPQMSASLSYKNNFKLPVSIIPAGAIGNPEDLEVTFGTKHTSTLSFEVTQLIVDGRYFIGLKANKAFMAISHDQQELSEIEVRQQIASSYYGALVAEESRRILETNIGTIERLHFETNELFKAGLTDELSVDRLTLSLNNLRSRYSEASFSAELSLNVLKYQMGMNMEQPLKLTGSLNEMMTMNADTSFGDFNYQNRVEFRLLNTQLALRGYDAQQVRANYFPSLVGFFGYGFNAQRQSFNFFDNSQPWFQSGYVGFQLNIPIFDSYKNGAIYQQKKLDMLVIENNIENFKAQSALQYKNALNDFKTATLNFQRHQESLELAQKIFDKVTIMSREGLASSLELAQAESSLTETQANYTNAIYNLLVRRVAVEKSLGKL
ncbi:TolC family protein [soil metagenome]